MLISKANGTLFDKGRNERIGWTCLKSKLYWKPSRELRNNRQRFPVGLNEVEAFEVQFMMIVNGDR